MSKTKAEIDHEYRITRIIEGNAKVPGELNAEDIITMMKYLLAKISHLEEKIKKEFW